VGSGEALRRAMALFDPKGTAAGAPGIEDASGA
jgi:hypothetical protein